MRDPNLIIAELRTLSEKVDYSQMARTTWFQSATELLNQLVNSSNLVNQTITKNISEAGSPPEPAKTIHGS